MVKSSGALLAALVALQAIGTARAQDGESAEFSQSGESGESETSAESERSYGAHVSVVRRPEPPGEGPRSVVVVDRRALSVAQPRCPGSIAVS